MAANGDYDLLVENKYVGCCTITLLHLLPLQ